MNARSLVPSCITLSIIRAPGQRIRAALCLLALCLSPVLHAAVELSPGVLVEADSKRVYLSAADGHMEARALSDGAVEWRSSERGLLIAEAGDRLLALGQAGRFGWGMLLLVDRNSGEVLDRIAFDLPETVSAAVMAEPMRRFDVRAEPTGTGMRLHWSYEAHPLRGALMLEEGAVASDTVQLSGVIDLELATAAAFVQPRPELQADSQRASPQLSAEERIQSIEGRQFRAADNRHVLVSAAVEDPVYGFSWRWQLYARNGVRAAAEFERPFALAPFVLVEDTLLLQSPPVDSVDAAGAWSGHGLRLSAVELGTGKELWGVELLDRNFSGPLPP
jgi:hypothetical protein